MAVNKVIYAGEVLLDLTTDTVTPDTLMAGATAHNAAGEPIVGKAVAGGLDGVGNEYLWDKRTKETRESTEKITKAYEDYTIGQISALYLYAYTSDTFPETGVGTTSSVVTTPALGFHIENWERVSLSFATTAVNSLKKYFWIPNINDGTFTPYKTYIYEKDANTTATVQTVMPNQYLNISGAGYWTVSGSVNVIPSEHVMYVNASDENAYPVEDDYDYLPLGQIGSFSKILSGSYTPSTTGTAQTIEFGRKPLLLFIDFGTFSAMFMNNGKTGAVYAGPVTSSSYQAYLAWKDTSVQIGSAAYTLGTTAGQVYRWVAIVE